MHSLNVYNYKKLHLTLGYVSPMTSERRWIAAQQQDRKAAECAALWSAEDRGKVTQQEGKALKLSALAPMPASCRRQRSTGADK